jgi:CMP-N-acetylneuraminate monooxygenase
MPILTADFLSGSTKNLIVDAGFTNIFAMDFISALVNSESEIFLSVLKSGDFRDDSGLFIQHGKFKCLLTVDSNLLNFGRFPRVDLLCSSFAGGASGFPLCFENYTELEKKAIIARNRGAIKATNSINIKSTKAKYFMPYAGFFVEKIERDHYIKKMNIKNTIEDYKKICISSRCELLNVNDNQYFTFKGSELIAKNIDLIKKMSIPDHSKNLIYNDQLVDKELLQKLFKYFQGCNFNDDLVVELIPTDGNFSNYSQRFTLDFKNNIYKKVDPSFDSKKIEIATLSTKLRYLQIKARKAELLDIIKKGKPWEDLSIGFQCRVYRMPNIYNSEFWFYFTNVYVGKSAATG